MTNDKLALTKEVEIKRKKREKKKPNSVGNGTKRRRREGKRKWENDILLIPFSPSRLKSNGLPSFLFFLSRELDLRDSEEERGNKMKVK